MKFFSEIKSGRWPFIAIGLTLAVLWGSLLFQNVLTSPPQTSGEQAQTAYEEVLPNFLAPVIRKEVHREASSEEPEESFAIKVTMPRLDHLIIWK